MIPGPPTLATRSRDRRMVNGVLSATLAPGQRAPLFGPPRGAAILQHDLYTASDLAVDDRPPGWLPRGGRGDSMQGLDHTSPSQHPRGPWGRGHGSHTPGDMYNPGPAVRGPGSADGIKKWLL